MMFDDGEYYSPSEMYCLSSFSTCKKKKVINKRRFSDDQVKSLESIFENETKLEPKKKVQVARELGLQPRQVAIWFQNKRARYKSKQLEQDYNLLRSNYNSLASQFETIKKEKESLLVQVQKLKDLLAGKGEEEKQCCGCDLATNSGESQTENAKSSESEITNNRSSASNCDQGQEATTKDSEHGPSMSLSEDGSSENTNNFFELEDEMLTMVEPTSVAGGSLTTSVDEAWDDLRPDGLFEEAVDSGQWWDFWS